MVLPDVNVLVYAHREDAAHHAGYRKRLETIGTGDEALGLFEVVLIGFVRLVTHESGCEWITTDRDFSRVKGLRWRHPFE